MIVKRGQIYLATLNDINTEGSEQAGTRPVIILQNDIGNRYSNTTIVALLTTKVHKNNLPTHIYVEEINSDIMLEQIKTISKNRLVKKIGYVKDLTELNIRLALSLGLINLHNNLKY